MGNMGNMGNMDRRNFVKAAALGSLLTGNGRLGWALPDAREKAADTAHADARHADGPLAARYELTLSRVLHGEGPAYTEEFLLADVRPEAVRRFTEYSGDLSGRYIGALATSARTSGRSFAGLDSLVAKVIARQKTAGYFGAGFNAESPIDEDLALLWGNGRLLVGLLEYYRLKPDAAVLAACKRLGDWLVKIGPLMLSDQMREAFGAKHFASSYICWMQQTEGLANLYKVTKDERYGKLAAEVAAVVERRPGDHVHGYLTSLRGVMDLHEATGDAKYLAQCEEAWAEVAGSRDALITGGVPEGWSPNNHRTEGCGECDWARLTLMLWKATEKKVYLEAAERTIFNELAFNQFSTGDFGHRVYTETGLPAQGAARAWWCCTLHGLRAFPDVEGSVFRSTAEGLWFDLPLDGRMPAGESQIGALRAVASSTLGENGTVRITITAAGTGTDSLYLRKPKWAEGVEIRTSGSAKEYPAGDGYVGLDRVWVAGDTVEVKYAMGLRSEAAGGERVAYFYGPWLLGASAADNPAYFNELTAGNRLVRGEERALGGVQPKRAFVVPVAATEAACLPAEYPDQPGRVVLRALAEQTGMETTGWELRFLGAKQG